MLDPTADHECCIFNTQFQYMMSDAKKIFIDECGYTGEDLFNMEQPVFTLSSIYLSEDVCEELKQRHFSKVKARELKHSQLVRNPSQQDMIINFLREISKNSEIVKFAIAHKRYVLVTKIVDLIIEPMAYDDGMNFYEKGLNIAFSNMLYYLSKSIASEKFFQNMIFAFQTMIRKRTFKAYNAFFRLFFEYEFPEIIDDFFVFLKASHLRYGTEILTSIPKDSLEIAFAEAFTLVAEWSKTISGNIIIVHDKSSGMAKKKELWDRVLHPDIPPKVVGYDSRKMYFPIRVEKTDFRNSKDLAGLQLVDILAGAMTRCMKWKSEGQQDGDDYAKELFSFLPECFGGHMIWPSPCVTPEDLGTTGDNAADPIEHFIQIIKGSRSP